MAITDLIAQGGTNVPSPVDRYIQGKSFEGKMAARKQQMQRLSQRDAMERGQEYAKNIAPVLKQISDLESDQEKQSMYQQVLPTLEREAKMLGLSTDNISPQWDQAKADMVVNRFYDDKESGRSGYVTKFEGKGGEVYLLDHRTGKIKNTGLLAAKYDPEVAKQMAYQKQYGKEMGGLFAQAENELPSTEASADQTVKYIEELVNHPGMKDVVGLPDNPLGLKGYMWGTPAADFKARLDQLTGRSFMQVFPTLKGGGQITEVEGQKATDAISRMKSASSEKAFLVAANDLVYEINQLRDLVRKRAGKPPKNQETEMMEPVEDVEGFMKQLDKDLGIQ